MLAQRHGEPVAGSLLGQCLGDALGLEVEGQPRTVCADYVARLNAGEIPETVGQYSDDSQLARELLQSLVAYGRFDPSDYGDRIARIFRDGRIVGPGHTTRQAAVRLDKGVPWDQAGTPPPAAGNGSAMRAGPIGLVYARDTAAHLIAAAHDQGRITHQDPRCAAGAIAIAGAVALACRGATPTTYTATLAQWTQTYDPILAEALEQLDVWVALSPADAVRRIAPVGLPHVDWDGISGFVTGSVLWSLYAFLRHPDDYWAAITTAIGGGGDTDTTAAMTGAIVGARVGIDRLPHALVSRVHDRNTWTVAELSDLAQRGDLLKNYRATEYWVTEAPHPFCLRVDQASTELTPIYAKHQVRSAAFMTAWNPGSKRRTDDDNQAMQTRLVAQLNKADVTVLAGDGRDSSGEWPAEASVLALGVELAEAKSLGRQFGQHAIVWAGKNAVPQLIVLWE